MSKRFTNVSGTDTIRIFWCSDLYPDWEYVDLPPGQVVTINAGQFVEYRVEPEGAHNSLRIDTYY